LTTINYCVILPISTTESEQKMKLKPTLNSKIIDDIKNFSWQKTVQYGNSLDDLNDAQLRFLKGLAIEHALAKYSGKDGLVYVGLAHKDYDWPKYQLTVELKSHLSRGMYGKKGKLSKHYLIKLNNSNGTNKKVLPPDEVADILIAVYNDGAFAVDKETVLKNAKCNGDGFVLKLHKSDIIEISGRILITEKTSSNLKTIVLNAIINSIPD